MAAVTQFAVGWKVRTTSAAEVLAGLQDDLLPALRGPPGTSMVDGHLLGVC